MKSSIIIWQGIIHRVIVVSVWMLLASHRFVVLEIDPFLLGQTVSWSPVLCGLKGLFEVLLGSVVNHGSHSDDRDLEHMFM